MDGATTWGQESLRCALLVNCCPQAPVEEVCGLEDSAEAEACSRVRLQWET